MPSLEFFDLAKADKLREEMKSVEAELHQRIAKLNRAAFVNHLCKKRRTAITESFRIYKIDFRKWLAIDDLLIYVSLNPPVGNKRKLQKFESVLSDYQKLFEQKCFIEDVENGRYLISTDKKVYWLKYWPALLDFYKTHGIVAGIDTPISEAFRYYDVDKQVKETVSPRFGEDLGRYFQQCFDLIINLGYMFEYQYLTANQHRYDPTGLEIATILGLSVSAKQEIEVWPCEMVKAHFERTSRGLESFEKFYEKYVSGRSLAPLIVFNGRGCLFDAPSLSFYSLYLININRRMSLGQTGLGARSIAAKREEASVIFEQRVRQQLRKAGFVVPEKSLKVREQNEKHEYDAIGVSEAKSQVVMAEAKYRDFAPSSICGKTLVRQELLDRDRLLDWVADAQSKFEFFNKHGHRFKRELSLHKETKDYDADMWVVTKFKPLISKYQSVKAIDFCEFAELFNGSPNTR
jgi:hypothetical protein